MTFTVMTVCTGNICRSPMAEVVLRDAFERAGLGDRVTVRSTAVTSEEIGNPIDSRAQRVLREAGYDVPRREAVRVRSDDAARTDLTLAMTRHHARELRRLGFPADEVVLFRAFEDGAPDGDPAAIDAADTPDPWYGGPEDFAECLETVEACAPGVVEYVSRRLDAAS
ncbi:low molecular weight protein-tyrosine-phosphatase [Salana multivorans]|uniref:low molecular weight protein-tyrosine-phosphatase n=1 Tax=Salana multivorans TaxID=120377 RepID=UPI000B26720A|nr:low molecular weight protein-tyrosine-phosphatase [Salana multivorans]